MIQLLGSRFGHAGSTTKPGACVVFGAGDHSSASRSSTLAFFSASAALPCADSRALDDVPPTIAHSNNAAIEYLRMMGFHATTIVQ